jgi:hypothetical protein
MLGTVLAGDISAEQEVDPPPPEQVPCQAATVSACAVDTPAAAANTVAAPNKRAILFEVTHTPPPIEYLRCLTKTSEITLVKSNFLDKFQRVVIA